MGEIIMGSGIDLVECDRIEKSIERFGDRFLKRIFLPGEIEYCQSQKFPCRHLAARFAAKEAVSKTFGTGIGKDLGWRDMEVVRLPSGEPELHLHGKGLELLKKCGGKRVLISLTHTDDHAAANAILIGHADS